MPRMQIPNLPDLDASSDDLSESQLATTTTSIIKPGGEDSDPVVPTRSVSPAIATKKAHLNDTTNGHKLSSHRKMCQKTRLANPLDAFDKSPETSSKKKHITHQQDQATTTTTTTTSSSDNNATSTSSNSNSSSSNNENPYGYEDAAPRRRNRSPPPMSMSAGAARALRRGVPAAAAHGLGKGPGSATTSPTGGPLRRLPNRSNLKKSSSFNEGVKKTSSLASAVIKDGEPTRGVTRRASMGSTHTTTIEVRIRGERFPVQRRRSINFDQRVEIKEVEPITSMVEKCSEIWLQEEDFVKMKQDRRTLVHKLKKKEIEKGSEEASSIRGLEKYIDKSIRAAKNLAWDTVLLEQDEQELSGDYNEERIADLYRHFTRESPDKAVARAKQDQEDIQDYLWSPRTTKLMLRRLPSIPTDITADS